VTSKTVSLKKTIVGLTPIRESDINSQAMTDLAPARWPGGVLPQPGAGAWTPTGTNVPDYPRLAQLWSHIAEAASGEKTRSRRWTVLARTRTHHGAAWNAPKRKPPARRS
jgi:glycerol transport system substrate-binding protein